MRRLSGILTGGLLVALTAGPALGQADAWQRKWFWGAHTGLIAYSLPGAGSEVAPLVGGHWLITASRSALFLGIDQIFYPAGTSADIGGTNFKFRAGRRYQAQLLAIPVDGSIQFWIGGGVGIQQATSVKGLQNATTAVQDLVQDAATGAFAVGTAGIQLRFGTRWAFYGSYQYVPANGGFIIRSEQHALHTGLRVSLGSSHEGVTTQGR